MKAIITMYQGPSNTRGARIRAHEPDGKSVTVSYDHGLSAERNHGAAAVALCKKLGWTGTLIQGGLKGRENVFVFSTGERYPVR